MDEPQDNNDTTTTKAKSNADSERLANIYGVDEEHTSKEKVFVEISVELGKTAMQIRQLLRMGRGAVIELDTDPDDHLLITANNHPIAKGNVEIQKGNIGVKVEKLLLPIATRNLNRFGIIK